MKLFNKQLVDREREGEGEGCCGNDVGYSCYSTHAEQ